MEPNQYWFIIIKKLVLVWAIQTYRYPWLIPLPALNSESDFTSQYENCFSTVASTRNIYDPLCCKFVGPISLMPCSMTTRTWTIECHQPLAAVPSALKMLERSIRNPVRVESSSSEELHHREKNRPPSLRTCPWSVPWTRSCSCDGNKADGKCALALTSAVEK